MSTVAEDLKSIQGIRSLLLEGGAMSADVTGVLTAADIEFTIEGASTLTLEFHDRDKKTLKAGLFSSRVTAQVDQYAFELAQVKKTGPTIVSTFEDLAVAALRRRDSPRKVAAGTMTHLDFAKSILGEDPWIKLRWPPGLKVDPAKVELSRGKPDDPAAEREDSWTTLGRIAEERGWRRFAYKGEVWYVPEPYLMLAEPSYRLTENARNGVDSIDFDFDSGKPVATATVHARTGRWNGMLGEVVELYDLGPADGKWLVSSLRRSLFSLGVEVGLTQARPILPEPEPPPSPLAETLGPEGAGVAADTGSAGGAAPEGKSAPGPAPSAQGFIWPARGEINSGFGMRGGRMHEGIDIGVGIGTPVLASTDGTVLHAGAASGYGIAVYIKHLHGSLRERKPTYTITRYGHLSRVQCARGQVVKQGDQIALSGNTGHSTGPHLHFEIRPNDKPANPLNYLSAPVQPPMRMGRPY